jgi:hypothetical protein
LGKLKNKLEFVQAIAAIVAEENKTTNALKSENMDSKALDTAEKNLIAKGMDVSKLS